MRRDLPSHDDCLRLQRGIARAICEAPSLEAALDAGLSALCEGLGWPVGHLTILQTSPGGDAEAAHHWHLRDPERCKPLVDATAAEELRTARAAMAGVLGSAEPRWVADVQHEVGFARRDAARAAGLQRMAAFRILDRPEIVAAIECFGEEARPAADGELDILEGAGATLGAVIAGRRWSATTQTLERHLDAVLRAAEVGLWEWDLTTQASYLSSEWRRQTGVATGEGSPGVGGFVERIHPDDRERLMRSLAQAIAGTDSRWESEFRIVHDDGSTRMMLARGSIDRDPDGRAMRVCGCQLDVTARRATDEQLRLHTAALEAAVNSIVITDASGAILWANRACERMTGYSVDELRGKNPRILKSGEQDAAWYEGMWSTIRRGQAWSGTLVNRRRDGSLYTEEMTIAPLVAPGEERPSHYIAVKQDVTERHAAAEALRRSEERFRLLIENSADIVVLLGADGTIRYVSPSIEGSVGYRPDALVSRPAWNMIHPDDRERVVAFFRAHAPAAGPSPTIGFRMRHRDGTWRHFEVVGNNQLFNPALEAVLVSCRDVTEKRRLEGELLQAQKMEAVGRLAGGIAHDFNNLLTVILSYSEALPADLPEDHPLRADLEEIHKAGERAAALTRQLLTFSRKQATAEPQQFAVNRLVSDLIKLIGRIVGEDIEVDLRLDPSAPELLADPGQIEQVVMNLVVNARDAMPRGGHITIGTSVVELDGATGIGPDRKAGPYVALAVSDTGCGISPETLPRIFEPFFTTKPHGQGTGLGLATCFAIVRQAGGFIVPRSEPGRGTTMCVYLPRVTVAQPAARLPEPQRLVG